MAVNFGRGAHCCVFLQMDVSTAFHDDHQLRYCRHISFHLGVGVYHGVVQGTSPAGIYLECTGNKGSTGRPRRLLADEHAAMRTQNETDL